MVFPGARLFRAPIWCPSGGWRHARGREHCRGEPGSALSGGYAPDSAKAEGRSIVDEPGEGRTLCARITGLNLEVSEGIPCMLTRGGIRLIIADSHIQHFILAA